MATATVPGIYDPTLANLHVEVSTDDARQMAQRLAVEEGYSWDELRSKRVCGLKTRKFLTGGFGDRNNACDREKDIWKLEF